MVLSMNACGCPFGQQKVLLSARRSFSQWSGTPKEIPQLQHVSWLTGSPAFPHPSWILHAFAKHIRIGRVQPSVDFLEANACQSSVADANPKSFNQHRPLHRSRRDADKIASVSAATPASIIEVAALAHPITAVSSILLSSFIAASRLRRLR